MKSFIFIFILLKTVSCISQEAVFSIKEPLKKFEKVKEGELIEHSFQFKNTGNAPLIISDYSVGCKCTQVYFPEEPILPNQTGVVRITFDTKGKYFQQDRVIYLMVNTKKKVVKLRFKVFVEPKEASK